MGAGEAPGPDGGGSMSGWARRARMRSERPPFLTVLAGLLAVLLGASMVACTAGSTPAPSGGVVSPGASPSVGPTGSATPSATTPMPLKVGLGYVPSVQ